MNEGKVIDLLLLADAERRPEMPFVLAEYKTCLLDVHKLLLAQRDLLSDIGDETPEDKRKRLDAETAAIDKTIKDKWRTCFEVISQRLFPV
jgi:hypothetical protein